MVRKQYLAIENYKIVRIYSKFVSSYCRVFSRFLAKNWNFVVNTQIVSLIYDDAISRDVI